MHTNRPPYRPRYSVKQVEGVMIDADEEIRHSIGQHPIGLIMLYLQVAIGIIALVIVFIFVAPDVLRQTARDVVLISGFTLFGLLFAGLFLLVATYLYRQNRLLLTNKHVVQIAQMGLFHRKVSQLSMGNIEDVTADQKGFLATIFNYGTIRVETAGEQKNFEFKYCANPSLFAQFILDERENFMRGNGTFFHNG